MQSDDTESLSNIRNQYGALIARSPGGRINLGDYIQSIAARQFFNAKHSYVHRDKLNSYDGENIKIIMNAWFKHAGALPPSNKIHPLVISIHLDKKAMQQISTPEGLAFLKKHEPIGCRDYATVERLKKIGVAAYFSGCLTTTLGETYKREKPNNKIYVVDPLLHFRPFKALCKNPRSSIRNIVQNGCFNVKKHIINSIKDKIGDGEIEYITHWFKPEKEMTEEDFFNQAHKLLQKYAAAKLVITSRIHCALPCLGMGTPVIFIDDSVPNDSHADRFKGLVDLVNTIRVTSDFKINENFDTNLLKSFDEKQFNPTRHLPLVGELIRRCKEFAGENFLNDKNQAYCFR
jgi:hypothetical protein